MPHSYIQSCTHLKHKHDDSLSESQLQKNRSKTKSRLVRVGIGADESERRRGTSEESCVKQSHFKPWWCPPQAGCDPTSPWDSVASPFGCVFGLESLLLGRFCSDEGAGRSRRMELSGLKNSWTLSKEKPLNNNNKDTTRTQQEEQMCSEDV